jgi:hypothetical protein
MEQTRRLLKLHMVIESLRIRMYETEQRYGLNHPKTLRMSQRLDVKINQFETARKTG